MAIVIGGSSNGNGSGSNNYLNIGWNDVVFTGADLSKDKNGKDYLQVLFTKGDNEIKLFQSEGYNGKYRGILNLQNIVNGYIQMYCQVSRPTIEGLTPEATEVVVKDWEDKCLAFEELLGSTFVDFNKAEYDALDEPMQVKMLGEYFIDASCKAFCDEDVENILTYKGCSGKLLGHYVFNKDKNAWFTNVVSFDKVKLQVLDEEGNPKKNNKGYLVAEQYTPFTTEDADTLQGITSRFVLGKYDINFTKGETAQAPVTPPVADSNPVENW
jgi:hypothetical protein